MQPLQLLKRHWQLSVFDDEDHVLVHSDETPAAAFNYFISDCAEGQWLVCAPCKTGCHLLLIRSVLQAAKSSIESGKNRGALTILPSTDVAPFQAVAVLSSAAHTQFLTFDPGLHTATVIAFPTYLCEFAGDEPPEIVRLIRQDFLPSLEWDRTPHPKLLAAFANPRTGIQSVSAELKLAKLEDIISILGKMEGCTGAWVQLRNWRGQSLKVTFDGGFRIALNAEASAMQIVGSRVEAFVREFATGLKSDAP